jgi:hypothetical protein
MVGRIRKILKIENALTDEDEHLPKIRSKGRIFIQNANFCHVSTSDFQTVLHKH